jgi:hypothetical protein
MPKSPAEESLERVLKGAKENKQEKNPYDEIDLIVKNALKDSESE